LKDELLKALVNLDEEEALALVEKQIEAGQTPLEIVEICKNGVEIVGKRYSEGHYFLADLIMAEEILKGIMGIVEPYLSVDVPTNGISIVFGTIEGDIHDLGKNIMIYLLRSSGFQVYDLGVDVSPEQFVKAVSETGAPILGISVLLSFCVGSIKKVVDLLEEAGLREQVKVVIGGYPVNQTVKEYTGADYYATDVTNAIAICRGIIKK